MNGKALMKNSTVSFITQLGTMLISFIMQSIFVRFLGGNYVGANGLFTNVLSILSFTELGIGNAAAFSLYSPLKEKNIVRIKGILSFLKIAYTFIGIVIFVIGIILTPMLPYLVHGQSIANFKFYFILFVLNSSISYFFSYKRTFLIADQKSYVTNLNIFYAKIITSILQMISLMMHSYFGFLIIQIIGTVISNLLISKTTNKLYKNIFPVKSEKMQLHDKRVLFKSAIGVMGQQIGGIIVKDTNNLLISSFVGLMATGIYSGYMLIINGILSIFNQVVNSTIATMGSWNISFTKDRMIIILERHLFLVWTLSYFIIFWLIGIINPFIQIWLGKNYNFNWPIVLIILFNLYFSLNRLTLLSFIQAQGLFIKTGIKSIIEAIINVIASLSLLMVFHLGVLGVLLGTTFVNIVLNLWFDPWIVYKEGFKEVLPFKYFLRYIVRLLITFVPAIIVSFCMSTINSQNIFVHFLLLFLVQIITSLVIFFIYAKLDKNYLFFKEWLTKKILKFKNF